MSVRVTTYLDNDTAKKLDKYENKSKLMKEALNMYFFNKDYFMTQEKVVENNIKELEFKLENEKCRLNLIRKQMDEIDRRKSDRPKNYTKSVYTLKALPDVTQEDISFQAELLKVDAGQLKEWLWIDGYYEEIFYK